MVATSLGGYSVFHAFFLEQSKLNTEAALRLASTGLSGALQRFEPIPFILADRADIRRVLTGAENASETLAVNRALKSVAEEIGASDIYIMNADGLTVSASNYEKENTFIGNNYLFRPYFSEAIAGVPSRYFALGTSSLKRGFYFSAPVLSGGAPIGVLAVKFEVDDIEKAWEGFSHELIVTDPDGIIFMSSQPDWLFTSLQSMDPDLVARLEATRKYPISELSELDAVLSETDQGAVLEFSQESGGDTFYIQSQYMPEAGWTLQILTDATSVTRQTWQATAITVLLLLLLTMTAGLLIAGRNRQIQRFAEQREAKELLETRVEERTAELQREVGERIQAEKDLRRAQRELVQAGKLAALGQMSASLSHELNQPLAAVKSYAENAVTFIERDRTDDAKENLTRISGMTDRMAQISNSLRNFARKPRERIGTVDLAAVLSEAAQIMSGRVREANATLNMPDIADDLIVVGGHVRLQQVIVNLINNALDAMSDQSDPVVEVSVSAAGKNKLALGVRDYGAGISDDIIESIFDPFFTTKGVNEGLGLGLSISFNILRDFGGNLSAENHPNGGAVFKATLIKADQLQKAAE